MPGGDLRNVMQQDIASITVLKDAAAAAIYGSRGANGVVLVETKKGKSGRVTLTYDSYAEHDAIAAKPNILSADEYLAKNRGNDQGARTNWYDELIRKDNFGTNQFLTVSGGNENSIFRLSGTTGQNKVSISPRTAVNTATAPTSSRRCWTVNWNSPATCRNAS